MLGLGAVSVWRLLRAGRVGIRFVLRCVFVADLTVLFVCVDVDWDMERTRGQCTLRDASFAVMNHRPEEEYRPRPPCIL